MAFIKPSGQSDFTMSAVEASERATSIPALAMLKQCGLIPFGPVTRCCILDNACGAGIVTKQFLSHVATADRVNLGIMCSDLDNTMVKLTQDRIQANGWGDIVSSWRIDAHKTFFEERKFTHILMNFGPQLMRDAEQMLTESHRILAVGGILGFTTWIKPGFISSMKAVFPDWNSGATPVAGEWRDAEKIKEILEDLGFSEPKVEALDFETSASDDVEQYLELMTQFLMAKFFQQSDNKARYSEYMRQPGKMKMQWQALVVSAKKNDL